jgi:predicted ribosomally synthesized peptide with SipW-like signal peptide
VGCALLTGVGTTAAVLTDSKTVSLGTVGAGSVALTAVTPSAAPLAVNSSSAPEQMATLTVRGATTGPATLWLSAVPDAGWDCRTLPQATVVIGRPGEDDLAVKLCDLVDKRQEVLDLSAAVPTAQLSLRVTGVPASATKPAGTAWTGVLHVTLEQTGGGFSDARDVPASITKPGSASGTGNAGGNGNGHGQGNATH